MPRGLYRDQQTSHLHFITFSCYQRKPLLGSPSARDVFVRTVERVRSWYGLQVFGYVVMPEHVHLLVSEPDRGTLATELQMLKQVSARELRVTQRQPFWYTRYYDFNVWPDRKRVEKLRYLHRNPVRRGLAVRPEDWPWSSFLYYATGAAGLVMIGTDSAAKPGNQRSPTLSPTTGDKDGAPSSSASCIG